MGAAAAWPVTPEVGGVGVVISLGKVRGAPGPAAGLCAFSLWKRRGWPRGWRLEPGRPGEESKEAFAVGREELNHLCGQRGLVHGAASNPRRTPAATAGAGDVSDISRFLNAFHEPHAELIRAARQLLADEQAPLRRKLLADLLHSASQNIAAEARAEDPPWFEGLESRFRSKSSYLRFSCESRIRSYLREVSSYVTMVGSEAREEYLRVLGAMEQKLKSVRYNGSYFDRGAEAGSRLCTPEGWFSCQGPFDQDGCLSRHSINPYSNRESRVLFSTWNLDHIIEKKRTIVPTLAEAVGAQNGREVDWEYFYGLLFTTQNLKLVHVVCHKKTTHKLSCDPGRVYRAPAKRRARAARKRR